MLAPPDNLRRVPHRRGRATRAEIAARLDAIFDRIKPAAKDSERRPPQFFCKVDEHDAASPHARLRGLRIQGRSKRDQKHCLRPYETAEAAMMDRGLSDDDEKSPTLPNRKDSIRVGT